MIVRIDDAIAAAVDRGEMHHAYPSFEGMTQDDLTIMTVAPDSDLGWRLAFFQGRYDGTLQRIKSGQPSPAARQRMQNIVFHPSGDSALDADMVTADAVRRLEGHGDEISLHPRACRTIVEACRMADRRVPIRTPSPFVGLHKSAGIVGLLLLLANLLAAACLTITWGHVPNGIRQYVLSTTVVTLGLLTASPFLISRMSREAKLFISPQAKTHSRMAVMRLGQTIVILAIMSATNGMLAIA